MKILIADDEMIVRIGMQSLLNTQDIELVDICANGAQAMQRLKKTMPDILITDLKMPEMDGLELITKIREDNLPVGIIVLSGYDDFDLVRQAMKLGADEYLLKLQLSKESLMSAIDETSKKVLHSQKNLGATMGKIQVKKSVKTVLSDVFSDLHEISRDDSFHLEELRRSNYRYSMCILICCEFCGEEGPLIHEMIENIAEDIFNEQFTAYCFKAESSEYVLTVFSDYENLDLLCSEIRAACVRYINMVYELLNILVSICIGSIDKDMGALKNSLKNAISVYFQVFLHKDPVKRAQSILDYDTEIDRIKAWKKEEDIEPSGCVFKKCERNFNKIENGDLDADISQPIRMAFEYMRNTYKEDITLQQIAEAVNLNASYFSALFSSTTNMTFTDYLTKTRMKNAKQLLKATNMKIYEIAELTGYHNSYYFSRVFRKYEGVTPVEYRNS